MQYSLCPELWRFAKSFSIQTCGHLAKIKMAVSTELSVSKYDLDHWNLHVTERIIDHWY